ncbi:hypothetical protein V1460_25030 [Streptomyces sp. SCSIO 30461]|uniref:hypothetical protein n=1 Tax=Streptomyces sp. SCSIO 30461 TaxID=3118085 RepID=UPI0030D4083A
MTAPAFDVHETMTRLVELADSLCEPAADMQDLAALIRNLLDVSARRDTRVRLGGTLFDVVITGGGYQARAALAAMDEIQGGCGPVIEDPDSGWLYWLVPPGTCGRWEPYEFGVCLGSPHTITLPSLDRKAPPGPYWLRPPASDRLVPTQPLRDVLAYYRPQPTPHRDLAAMLGITAPPGPVPAGG